MDCPPPSKQLKLTDAEEELVKLQASSKKDTSERESTLEILEQIDICQGELENLNEAASEEIISIEEKFNRIRQPHIDKRNEFILKIPNFWICTFVNHPQLAPRLSEEDEECLHYLRQLNVHNYDDLKTGYSITFGFADNPFFENKTISKEFSLTEDGEPISKCSDIQWKPGMDITKKLSTTKGRMDVPCASFFGWFTDHLDAGNDEIADVLRDDLWSNPLQYYLIPDVEDCFDKSDLMDSIYSDEDEEDEIVPNETISETTASTKDTVENLLQATAESNSSNDSKGTSDVENNSTEKIVYNDSKDKVNEEMS